MDIHKCDIDFEKHTPLMHLKLLVEKNPQLYSHTSHSHTYTLIQQ